MDLNKPITELSYNLDESLAIKKSIKELFKDGNLDMKLDILLNLLREVTIEENVEPGSVVLNVLQAFGIEPVMISENDIPKLSMN